MKYWIIKPVHIIGEGTNSHVFKEGSSASLCGKVHYKSGAVGEGYSSISDLKRALASKGREMCSSCSGIPGHTDI